MEVKAQGVVVLGVDDHRKSRRLGAQNPPNRVDEQSATGASIHRGNLVTVE